METQTNPSANRSGAARRVRPTAFLAQKFLAGLCYPADKSRIVETARNHGADARMLRVLASLPDCSYISPIALAVAIGKLG